MTEAELAAAASGGRAGPPPDLVTCHRPPAPLVDFSGAPAGEPSAAQLRLRLERLQTVRRAAGRERDHRLPPPPGPQLPSKRYFKITN